MTRNAFGRDAARIGDDLEQCRADGCDANSVIAGCLPMCERHLIGTYRAIGEYLRAKEGRKPGADEGSRIVEEFLVDYEFLRPPHGYCPECSWLLARTRATGDVMCVNPDCAGYAASSEDFAELFLDRVKFASEQREVVYYVRFGEWVKIGTTKNLTKRLPAIPHDELMATEPGGTYVEKQRHKEFAHLRVRKGSHREWFSLTPELAAHIETIQKRWPDPG